jgi:hypothetical protein
VRFSQLEGHEVRPTLRKYTHASISPASGFSGVIARPLPGSDASLANDEDGISLRLGLGKDHLQVCRRDPFGGRKERVEVVPPRRLAETAEREPMAGEIENEPGLFPILVSTT